MNHTGTITLYTERLILRRFTENDAPAMFANWAADREVTQYLPWKEYKSLAETQDYLREVTERYASPDFYEWCVVLKETGEPVGSCGAVQVNDDLRAVGLGCCLSRKVWGLGLAPEATQAMLRHFFETVGAARISAAHHEPNLKSGRVMQKCGMTYEGTLRKNAKDKNGNLVNTCVYSVLAEEYFARQKNVERQI